MLQAAVQSGSISLVHMLIERGCSVCSKGAFGYSALHQVAYTPFSSLCDFLLKNGGNLDSLSRNGSTPLLIASREGHAGVVESMLRYGADPNDGGDKGLTPLLLAAAEGHVEVVRLLLSFKGDANQAPFEGRSPLHEAVEAGHSEVCRDLIRYGKASIHAKDVEGTSPLMIAQANEKPDLVDILTSTNYEGIEYRVPDEVCKIADRQHLRLPPEIAFSN